MADSIRPVLHSRDPRIPNTHALTSVSSPFTGVTGRSFLKFCLWFGIVSSKIHRTHNASSSERMSSWRLRLDLRNGMCSWLGAGSCIVAAACLTRIFYLSSFKTTLPFVFLGIIVLVTMVFGRNAGVLGTLGAALIFASLLFEPRPSLAMEDPVAQTHLIWMIVIGVVVADLLGQQKSTQETTVIARKADQPKVSR